MPRSPIILDNRLPNRILRPHHNPPPLPLHPAPLHLLDLRTALPLPIPRERNDRPTFPKTRIRDLIRAQVLPGNYALVQHLQELSALLGPLRRLARILDLQPHLVHRALLPHNHLPRHTRHSSLPLRRNLELQNPSDTLCSPLQGWNGEGDTERVWVWTGDVPELSV